MEREKREYRADELKLKRLRAQFALTVEQFCWKAAMDKATARKLLKGTPVSLHTLKSAATVFGITDHLELLHPDELVALGVDPAVTVSGDTVQEWLIEARLTAWEKTANGLQYHVARLRHRFLPSRLARGKCYELRHLPVAERRRLEEHLRRHPEVCGRIGDHPNVAENFTATFTENGGLWWVLDKVEVGATLAERLADGPLEGKSLKTVMTGIAAGLDALHRERVVRRELSPRFVLLRKKDLTPVLTDFELAKLLDGAADGVAGGRVAGRPVPGRGGRQPRVGGRAGRPVQLGAGVRPLPGGPFARAGGRRGRGPGVCPAGGRPGRADRVPRLAEERPPGVGRGRTQGGQEVVTVSVVGGGLVVALPRVRVRTLGEFVFCPRAGLLSHASANEEDEPTDGRMNLNFLPDYSLTLIEEQLAVQLRRLARWAAWAAGGLFLVVVAASNDLPPAVPLALAVPTVLCVWKSLQALSAVVTLGDRRREALAATPAEPPADLADDTPVRWWELLKAGFESVPYLEPLFDGELALAGKPWRVLKKGSLRIPVVRLPADNYHAGRYWVYEQHRVRLAAYAVLLAACEGGQTPYAVVLFGGSYDGVAVPVLPAAAVIAKLDELRRGLDLERMGITAPLPGNPNVCSGCPFGRPRVVAAGGFERQIARTKAARRHRAGRAGLPQRVR